MTRYKTQDIVAHLGDNPLTHWQNGALVVIPTETVYGLSADAENGDAVARIYALKDRPRFNPLIVHVGSIEIAKQYAIWNASAEALAQQFWPGPLTMVLPLQPGAPVSDLVTAGGDTVALRMPHHVVTLELLRAFGRGVAAPSANRSGRISPTSSAHVRVEFGDACPLIVEGGDCVIGLESTVIDITNAKHPSILRPGYVTENMIINALGSKINVKHKASSPPTLRAPGQLQSHYAPQLPMRLNVTQVAPEEALIAFGPTPIEGAKRTINLSERAELKEAATKLFHVMRELDSEEYKAIAVMPIPDEGIGEAINDRLQRAAAPQ
jgi:L-threonylcarbamoyladenylate synthase